MDETNQRRAFEAQYARVVRAHAEHEVIDAAERIVCDAWLERLETLGTHAAQLMAASRAAHRAATTRVREARAAAEADHCANGRPGTPSEYGIAGGYWTDADIEIAGNGWNNRPSWQSGTGAPTTWSDADLGTSMNAAAFSTEPNSEPESDLRSTSNSESVPEPAAESAFGAGIGISTTAGPRTRRDPYPELPANAAAEFTSASLARALYLLEQVELSYIQSKQLCSEVLAFAQQQLDALSRARCAREVRRRVNAACVEAARHAAMGELPPPQD